MKNGRKPKGGVDKSLLALIGVLALTIAACERGDPTGSASTRDPSPMSSPSPTVTAPASKTPGLSARSSCEPAEPLATPPDNTLVEAVNAHVSGRKNDVIICQRKNGTTAFASLDVELEDDSIAEERHQLRLRLREGRWVVVQDDHLQRCQRGRGHQEFSKELCV